MFLQAKRYFDAKEYDSAEYAYKVITRNVPESWEAWFWRGVCLKRIQSYERARYCFLRVCEIRDDIALAWYNLGYCLLYLQYYQEAVSSLDIAMELNNLDKKVSLLKAWCYLNLKQNNLAELTIEKMRGTIIRFDAA
jgi:tetratricopeptide (TPR) repeat protein